MRLRAKSAGIRLFSGVIINFRHVVKLLQTPKYVGDGSELDWEPLPHWFGTTATHSQHPLAALTPSLRSWPSQAILEHTLEQAVGSLCQGAMALPLDPLCLSSAT